MEIRTVEEFRAALNEPFAWPGGYPRYFLCHDGEALSYAAAKENQESIEDSIANGHKDGWRVVAVDINWEDSDLTCAHSGARIESAYGEEEDSE